MQADVAQRDAAAALARQLGLPLCNSAEMAAGDFAFALQYQADGLQLQPLGAAASGPVWVDFVSGKAAHRRQFGGAELLLRAVRGRQQKPLTVLDATAGLGSDTLVLAGAGYQVTALERSPIVAALLRDGIERAAASDDVQLLESVARVNLLPMDAGAYLQSVALGEAPDVIYLDPMFPSRDKSAKVGKAMQALQSCVGGDEDSGELLTLARQCARQRVVVKRPLKAPCLGQLPPAHALSGKAVRFDVYLPLS